MKRPYALVLLVVAAMIQVPAASLAQVPPSTAVALVGGRLIDGTGRAPIDNSVVVIQGERILAAGPAGGVSVPRDATVIRVDGKTVMPGIIESNGHIIFSGQVNHTLYWARRLDRYYEIGARNLFTSLMQGVTSIRDTMDPLDVMLQLRGDVASGKIAGSRLFTCGTILNYPGIYAMYGEALKTHSPDAQSLLPEQIEKAREVMELVVRDAAHGREIVREYARRGVDFIKVSAFSGPSRQPPELSTEALREIVNEAHRHDLPVTTHTMSVASVRSVVAAGVDAMEHPELMDFSTKPGEGELPDDLVQEIVRQNIYSIPLLVAFEVYPRYVSHPSRLEDRYYIQHAPADMLREAQEWVQFEREADPNAGKVWEERYQLGRRNLQKLIAAKAPIAMGTDKGTRLNFHESMNHVRELELYVELGMTPMDAIVSATRGGAELLKKERELGTVEAGKLADVIVVDGNPLERMSSLRNVKMVFKGGVRYK